MKVIVSVGLIVLMSSQTIATEPLPGQPKVAVPVEACFDEIGGQAWKDYKANGTPIPLWLKGSQGRSASSGDTLYKRNWGFSSPRELVTAKIALDIIAPYLVSRSSCYEKVEDQISTDATVRDQRVIKTLEYVIRALGENGLLSGGEEKKALSLLEGK